jgi:hypothetical protein
VSHTSSIRSTISVAAVFAVTMVILLVAPASGHSAVYGFAVGSRAIDWGFGLATDEDGYAYLAGTFGAATDFDPSARTAIKRPKNHEWGDAFVARYTPGGALDWVITVPAGGEARDVTVDGQWLYVTGRFRGTPDFEPGPGETRLTAVGYTDAFVMRLSTVDGRLSWAKRFGGTRRTNPDLSVEWTDAIAITQHDVVVAGTVEGPVDFDPGPGVKEHHPQGFGDGFVLALDSDTGDFDWVSIVQGPRRDLILDMEVAPDGSIVTGGAFAGSADFDPGPDIVRRDGSADGAGFVLKLSPHGHFEWVRVVPAGTDGVAVAPNGYVYAAGAFSGTRDFDPGAGEATSAAGDDGDAYVVAYTSQGSFRWVATTSGSAAAEAVAVDALGRVVAAGWIKGNTDVDPGDSISPRRSHRGLDAFVWVLSPNRDLVSAHVVGGRGWQSGFAVAVDGTDILMTGVLTGDADLDPGPGNEVVKSNGSIDAYLVRLSE